MTGVAITILIKNPNNRNEKANIYYKNIGDYLSRKDKFIIIKKIKSVMSKDFSPVNLTPNEHNDWLNKRNELFENYIPIGDKDNKLNSNTIFSSIYSRGVTTSRDSFLYNFSNNAVIKNVTSMVDFYNKQRIELLQNKNYELEYDSSKIVWTDLFLRNVKKNIEYQIDTNKITKSIYRPFCKQNFMYDKTFIHRTYQMLKIYPDDKQGNLCISVSGVGANKPFSTLIVENVPCLDMLEKAQCFPLYWYEEKDKENSKQQSLFDNEDTDDKYIRHDGITDFIHQQAKEKYGHKVTKEDIFYYVYGILHSEDYRTKFAADLKKMLPRIPLVDKTDDFWAFSNAGRDLAKLHLNYEDQAPLSSVKVSGEENGNFKVTKMKFKSKEDKSEIVYNDSIKVSNIPAEAYEYVINGKSAIEWILDRYQVTINKDSQIKNDPNDWAEEHNKPRYILDLLLSVISLSVATVKIVKSLPKLSFEESKEK